MFRFFEIFVVHHRPTTDIFFRKCLIFCFLTTLSEARSREILLLESKPVVHQPLYIHILAAYCILYFKRARINCKSFEKIGQFFRTPKNLANYTNLKWSLKNQSIICYINFENSLPNDTNQWLTGHFFMGNALSRVSWKSLNTM